MTTVNVYNEDANIQLENIAPNSIDMVFASPNPPFYALKNNIMDRRYIGSEPTTSHYVGHLVNILAKSKRILKDTGCLWLHMGDFRYTDKSTLTMVPEVTASRILYEHQFILVTKGIWVREDRSIMESPRTFKRNWEHIFIFTKKAEPEYYFEGKDVDLRTSVWMFETKDQYQFPTGMVQLAIKTMCPENGVVLDPFMGDGTTGQVALNNKRHFVGIEIDAERCFKAKTKLLENPSARVY
jgi:DNA modification methylase